MGYELTYKPYGNHVVLIEWPQKIDENILNDILQFKNLLLENSIKQIVDIINAYNSLTIIYSSDIENIYTEISALKALYIRVKPLQNETYVCWKIPVCYDLGFGIDILGLAAKKDCSPQQLVKLHTAKDYLVYFIGFLPGFLYMGGLDKMLHAPRKENPRLMVPKGSVAIGGSQTGVYPVDSAGGWQIIGNSPLSFFDIKKENPCFAKPGDRIRFYSVDLEEYKKIRLLMEAGIYMLESEVMDA